MEAVPRSTTTTGAWLSVVVVRVLIVALAAGAVAVALLVVSRRPAPTARRYVCPMHSEVTAASAGDCPICGMALEQVDVAGRAAMLRAPAAGQTDDQTAEQVPFSELRISTEATLLLRFAVAQVRRNVVPGEIYAPAIAGSDGRIVAQLYRDELASLAPDELAEFVPSTSPGAPIAVRHDAGEPAIEGAIARVGFRLEPGSAAPPPDQVGWIKLGYKQRAMLIVRSQGILWSPEGPYVLTFSAQRGGLARHRIEIGKDYMGMTAVVSGLRDKEFVIMANAFSLDAERRQQAGP